jgi:hypothetical protein
VFTTPVLSPPTVALPVLVVVVVVVVVSLSSV